MQLSCFSEQFQFSLYNLSRQFDFENVNLVLLQIENCLLTCDSSKPKFVWHAWWDVFKHSIKFHTLSKYILFSPPSSSNRSRFFNFYCLSFEGRRKRRELFLNLNKVHLWKRKKSMCLLPSFFSDSTFSIQPFSHLSRMKTSIITLNSLRCCASNRKLQKIIDYIATLIRLIHVQLFTLNLKRERDGEKESEIEFLLYKLSSSLSLLQNHNYYSKVQH